MADEVDSRKVLGVVDEERLQRRDLARGPDEQHLRPRSQIIPDGLEDSYCIAVDVFGAPQRWQLP